ncbi:MAG: hypothetical protein KF861_12275 [Planctomycetaceae bacterium]|nr:hypothetical protein [Planctomycetaceae bacterium]
MNRSVSVTTGARLHFGPLSYRPAEGRHFGGVGLMIAEPGFELAITESADDEVIGESLTADRIRAFVQAVRTHVPDANPRPVTIRVVQAIPSHAGLGSGTQLGLAVARSLAELAGEGDAPIGVLAERVGRGRRSAVGVYGFAAGGLIVDAGKHGGDAIGALACRLALPRDWRILLLTPGKGRPGLSGRREEQAFEHLGSTPAALTDRLCRVILTELLPAAHAADFETFCDAVFDYGRRIGEFFRPVQGGTFGEPITDELVARLREQGIRGVGQTSWGPTLFAFAPSSEEANVAVERIQHVCSVSGETLEIRVVAPLNSGACVTVHS